MSAEGHTGKGLYWAVFAGLGVFTVFTVGAAYLHMPMTRAVPLALAIASVKTGLVAAYFMHLKGEKSVIYVFLSITVAFVIVLVTLPILDTTDLSTTMEDAIPAVHPVHSAHEAADGGAPAAAGRATAGRAAAHEGAAPAPARH